MKSMTLYYREAGSDKIYQAAVELHGCQFIVTFSYGRRETAFKKGIKTPHPVSLAEAERVFDKLIREKMAKGYTPAEGGMPYAETENAGRISGILPQLLNPVSETEGLALLEDHAWCLQEKKDGRRMLIKKEGTSIEAINRKGLITPLKGEILREVASFPHDFVIDGEYVGDTFHAFDLLSLKGTSWTALGFDKRLGALHSLLLGNASGNVLLVETHLGAISKLAAFKGFRECGAEGVVFRLLSAAYTAGRPASLGTALKLKFTTTGCFIVAGVNGGRSVSLRLYDEDSLLGNVTIPPNRDIPEVGSVIKVRYLYIHPGGSLIQPVYLGERDDIEPCDCRVSQLKFKREEADDDGE